MMICDERIARKSAMAAITSAGTGVMRRAEQRLGASSAKNIGARLAIDKRDHSAERFCRQPPKRARWPVKSTSTATCARPPTHA